MGSTFGGISNASTAMGVARYGLDVIQQNISNATTPGYTRQSAQQATVDSATGVPSIFTKPAGMGGVMISGTARMMDPVMTARARTEQARSAQADTTAGGLSNIENLFPEPSNTGLSEQLNDFWNAWGTVSSNPGAVAPRAVLLNKAATVASTLNAVSTSLSGLAASTTQSLTNDVTSANTAATQLATINGQIAIASATGASANALLDQRDALLTSLSTLVGGVATINVNGTADVLVGGQSLVAGVTTTPMSVGAGPVLSVGATAVALTGGSAAAEVTSLTTTIPNVQAQLDAVANRLSATVNSGQAAAFDLYGNPGAVMFSGTGAAGLTVAITDPKTIAAAATPGTTLDGTAALTMSGSGRQAGGPDSLYTTLVAGVGSASALAQQQQTTQDAVTSNVLQLQNSVSGVNTDEEVSNMLTYQHAYSAASRVLTTLDSMLDTLINHTGLVGQA
ncbi:MAG TPA: flagellar hook-associated protein FlgK [Jatrophihabitans sp.]|jgi:flagellar hook-associated protein 1 FlgK|uniref:flagellar hook-associated protein FlgK n=1 Tax=Jatrophihabitans sp. TaxID=1932789 RepID=UPI002E07B20A|nr:flagellar hook-associated protein FlgK [Jatrophihabitans sp.]